MSESIPPDLPPSFTALAGARWTGVTIGMSGARVWRVEAPNQPLRYLKLADGPHARDVCEERDRLRWLRGRLPVPVVDGWAEDGDRVWLLLSAATGEMAQDMARLENAAAVVRALAEGLRRIHSVPTSACPFDQQLDVRLARYAWNIDAGLVDAAAVLASTGASPRDLLRRLEATRPAEPGGDLVFTHGDYCLPNVLLALDGAGAPRVSGLLDWARAGVSDRYQDLAIGARSLRLNLGSG